ncbi:MAG: molybdopterin cofactor-binding domain-containing protein, partial [Polyangiaceae bacterium]
MSEVVGQGLDRVDARLKVTGAATYAAEVPVANVVHAVMVESTVAKGQLASIDARAAEQVPGVLAVLTHVNAPRLPAATKKAGPVDRVLQLLQDPRVLYSGQPVALVVADSLEAAQHAGSLVAVRYDAASPSVVMEASLGSAYKPASAGPSGETDTTRGDVAAGLAIAHATIDAVYTTPVENHNPMEPHATIAVWQGDDHLTLYDATQGIFGVRKKVATVFGLPPENVRVIS